MAPMDTLLHFLGLNPNHLLFGNPLSDWAYSLGLGLATFALLMFVRRQLAMRTRGLVGRELPAGLRLLLALVRRTKFFPLLAVSLGVGSKYLDLPLRAEKATTAVIAIMVAAQLGIWCSAAVRFYFQEQSFHSSDRRSQTMVTIIQFVANLAIWSIVLLLALDNLGFQVKALLTGLGIGGIAAALAEVPELVRAAVAACPAARFERAHLVALGPTGFDVEASYTVPGVDYAGYLAAVQAINLAILQALEQRGIAFSTLQPR